MKKRTIELQEAFRIGLSLPYAMLRSFSGVTLGKTPDTVDQGELLEARYFSEDQEVRIFRADDGLHGALLQQEAEDTPIEETYRIKNKSLGRTVTVRYDLDADEDGQTYVASTRLAGWEGGSANG